MNQLQKFIEKFGWFGFVRFCFYPLTVLITTPFRLIQSFWNTRVILSSKLNDYSHFNAVSGLNTLFYWTRALNLWRYGRTGKSPYLGLGDFNMARCFHYSKLSFYAYWKAPILTLFVGMAGWLFSHSVWWHQINHHWLAIVLCLAFISTHFYTNLFRSQNYNVLGWLFFPVILFGLLTSNWIVVGCALLSASFGSFTVVFISCLIILAWAVINQSIMPLLATFPACIKLLTHFIAFFKTDDAKKVLDNVMKAIGMTRKKAKYKRKKKGANLGLVECYHLLLILQFIIIFFLLEKNIPVLMVCAMAIYLVNSALIRFADEQSTYMLLFSVATTSIITNQNYLLLPSYWLLISPLPLLIGFDFNRTVLDIIPKATPFHIKKYIVKMEEFLAPMQKDKKVLMAFNDPQGIYENIFDGYRQFVELPSYVANQKEFLLLPEWWSVFELNYEGAPNIWGRDVESVKQNMHFWKADYAIVYQEEDELEQKWLDAKFELLSEFSWEQFKDDFKNHKRYDNIKLKWFLLRYVS